MRTDLLGAEAISWPLAAPDAFNRPRAELFRLLPSLRDRAVSLGFVEREADLAADDVLSTVIWTPDQILSRARSLLHPAGARATLRLDPDESGAEILRWRWHSLCLPALLWTAAATDPDLPPRVDLSLLHRSLAPTGSVAHQHLHAGAVFPFELVWSRLASTLDLSTLKKGDAQKDDAQKGDAQDDRPRPFHRWLVRAMVARRWLAHRLFQAPLQSLYASPIPQSLLDRALAELERGQLSGSDEREASSDDLLLARFVCPGPRASLQASHDVWCADPLFAGAPCPEAALLHAGLHRWDALGDDQTLFAQYLRVKVALFRHLRSDPAARGLPVFVQVYRRIKHYKSDLEGLSFDIARHEPELNLGAVELRTAPPNSGVDELLDLVTRRASSPAPAPVASIEWGWVLHLIRASVDVRAAPLRWHRQVREHLDSERTLARALSTWPTLLATIRGLDLAGDETSGPLWLALPSLMRLRALSDRICARAPTLTPLQVALHAGEDFGHLLTGLRAVHEPLAWGLLRAGDRLGHAIALGASVEAWRALRGHVEMTRWDRLLDLIWLVEVCPKMGVSLGPAQRERLDTELRALAHEIWGASTAVTPVDLAELYRRLGDIDLQARLNLVDPSPDPRCDAVDELLLRVLRDREVERRALDEEDGRIAVSRTSDADLLAPLQVALRRRVARAQVCVELNPSSNLLVASFGHPLDEPAFRLRPTDPARADLVPVSLSADDPLSFSTRLSDEYAYAWAGMVVNGEVGPRYAADWLDEAARVSWRFRFTQGSSKQLGDLPVPGDGDRQWRGLR